ncbi:MAG: acylphosphatase [Pirellulaceae bacterium]
MTPSTEMQRHVVLFRGRVQGVGFRYQTQRAARGFDVVGYVKNLPTGEVELVAEGAADELKRFVAAVRQVMDDFIQDVDINTGPYTGEFFTFEVRI